MNREVIAALKRIYERSEAQQRREVRETRAGLLLLGKSAGWLARVLDFGSWRA